MSMRCEPSPIQCEYGQSLAETALVIPLLLLLLLGVVDFGRAFYLSSEVAGAAHAGAVYGSQNPMDLSGMRTAALDNAPDVTGMTATASYGCECPDGSGQSAGCSSVPGCSGTMVYYVRVTASASYAPWFPWPGIPSTMAITNTVEMRSATT